MTPDHYHYFVKMTPESDPLKEWEMYCPICKWTKEEAMMIEKATKSEIPLRDWFAGQALTSGRVLFGSNIRNAEDLAKDMYKIADAMLKEREK